MCFKLVLGHHLYYFFQLLRYLRFKKSTRRAILWYACSSWARDVKGNSDFYYFLVCPLNCLESLRYSYMKISLPFEINPIISTKSENKNTLAIFHKDIQRLESMKSSTAVLYNSISKWVEYVFLCESSSHVQKALQTSYSNKTFCTYWEFPDGGKVANCDVYSNCGRFIPCCLLPRIRWKWNSVGI